ncbi:NUDIX domain-containing protein [Flexivirga sp.]
MPSREVQPDESPSRGVVRELREESGIQVAGPTV